MARSQSDGLGARIRRYRQEQDLSLNQLAIRSGVSKGYLWSLENDEIDSRPSAQTLYAIAEALGVMLSDLFGHKLDPDEVTVPASLREFADEESLPDADVQMLASIRFRGEQPNSKERWRFIYTAISQSTKMDPVPKPSKPRGAGR